MEVCVHPTSRQAIMLDVPHVNALISIHTCDVGSAHMSTMSLMRPPVSVPISLAISGKRKPFKGIMMYGVRPACPTLYCPSLIRAPATAPRHGEVLLGEGSGERGKIQFLCNYSWRSRLKMDGRE